MMRLLPLLVIKACCTASFLLLLLPRQTLCHSGAHGLSLPHDAVLPTKRVDYGPNHPFELRRRRLEDYDDDGFEHSTVDYDFNGTEPEPIRIRFITTLLEDRKGESDELDKHIDMLLTKTLSDVASAWARHLYVHPAQAPIPLDENVCFGNFDSLDNDLFEDGVPDTDLVILVGAENRLYPPGGGDEKVRVCRGSGQIALALSCALDQWDRPIVGIINFCLPFTIVDEDDVDEEKAMDDVRTVAMHELAHVLGMEPFLFRLFRDPATGEPLTPRNKGDDRLEKVTCVDGNQVWIPFPSDNTVRQRETDSGSIYYEIVTPTVATVVRNHFNCQTLKGARLENQAVPGVCIGDHWDERLFFTELLGQRFTGRSDYLSPLTLALMADTGWYPRVSFQHAEASPFGKGLGCDFVNSDCIVDGEIPAWGKDIFCDRQWDLDDPSQTMCDPSNKAFATCNLVDLGDQEELEYIDQEVPDGNEAIRYFSDADLVGLLAETEYCPMPIENIGTDCTVRDGNFVAFYDGEEVGSSSRCVHAFEEDTIRRPLCMRIACSETGKVILGSGDYQQTCEYDGQMLKTSERNGLILECPRFAAVCSHMVCPLDCSGAGTCSYETSPPSCDCFDADDKSIDCRGTFSMSGTELQPESSPSADSTIPSPVSTHLPTSVAPVSTISGAPTTIAPGPAVPSPHPSMEPVEALTHDTGSPSAQPTPGSSSSVTTRLTSSLSGMLLAITLFLITG